MQCVSITMECGLIIGSVCAKHRQSIHQMSRVELNVVYDATIGLNLARDQHIIEHKTKVEI